MNAGKLMFVLAAAGVVVTGVIAYRLGWIRGRRSDLRRDVFGVEAVVWLLVAMLMFLAPFVGSGIVSGVLGARLGGREGFEHQAAAQACGYALAIGVGLLVVALLAPRAGPRAGLRVAWGDLPRGILALAMLAPVYLVTSQISSIIARSITQSPPELVKHETLTKLRERITDPGAQPGDAAWAWLLIAAVVIGAPIVEELTYRLGLQSALLRITRGAWGGWGAVLLTSAVFAPMHASVVPWSAVPSLFVLSVGLGLAYERTGRLGVPIVMHAMFNALNIAAVMIGLVG